MVASPLDRLLSEDQAMIAEAVRGLARDMVAPNHERWDHAGTHPDDLWQEVAGLGLFGVFVPENLGGAGAGCVAHVVAIEALAQAAGLAGVLPVAQGMVTGALLSSGDEAALGSWLEGLASGEVLGAPAFLDDEETEPCAADGDGATVRLRGRKTLVPFPGRAGVYLVRALRGPDDVVCLVPAGTPGVTHGAPEPSLGLSGLETGPLVLEDAEGQVLGGASLLDAVLTDARIAVAALLCGIGRGALLHALRYSGERQQFKLELRRFGAIQERLARSDAGIEAAAGLTFLAAAARDAGQPAAQAARRARAFAATAAMSAADHAVQIFGGYGFSREYPVERFYRDARFLGFGEHVPSQFFADTVAALGA